MSDFTSNFWSVFVAGITIVSILGCLLLLWISGTTKAMTATGDNTTGHVWDVDLREMNNPLPRWWVWMFIITVLFSLAYLALFPGLGAFKGMLGWSSTGQFDQEVQAGNDKIAPMYAQFAGMSIPQLSKDDKAMAVGDRLFMNNCAQCHGSDAKGGPSYPNLTSGEWNWGGTPEKIVETITDGRMGVMPPQAAVVGTAEDVSNVANYVLGLSNAQHDAAKAAKGKEKFEAICSACHGMDGKGNQLLGSRDLAGKNWFLGPRNEEHVAAMVNNGWMGQMPTWKDKFTPEQIRVLAAYVWKKGGVASSSAAAADGPSIVNENGVVKFYFASGSAQVAPGAQEALVDVVKAVQGGKRAAVSGYHDASGDAAQNAELAKQRALAVAEALKAAGVPEASIDLSKPDQTLADGTPAEARRVEGTLE